MSLALNTNEKNGGDVGTCYLERRSEPRRLALLAAQVEFSKGTDPVPCVVADLSRSGAGLYFDDPVILPKFVWLTIMHPHQQFRCEVRWSNEDQAGLKFID